MLGVPRLSAVLAFAAYAVVAAVSLSFDKSSAVRATFVSVAFVGFTATALYFNMQRAGARDAVHHTASTIRRRCRGVTAAP